MKPSESPIIHFVRSATLLATLGVVPGIAIFWNHLPRSIANPSASKRTIPQTEIGQSMREDSSESARSMSMLVPGTIYPPSPVVSMEPTFSSQAPKTASEVSIQQVSWDPSRREPPQNFESLQNRLKALGATYYRLEKWGNRGELFRFSCFVTPSESDAYEKHFQSIGADAVTVMCSVITDIEAWKSSTHE